MHLVNGKTITVHTGNVNKNYANYSYNTVNSTATLMMMMSMMTFNIILMMLSLSSRSLYRMVNNLINHFSLVYFTLLFVYVNVVVKQFQ